VNATSDWPKSFAAAVPSSVPHNGECRYALGHSLVNQESNAARRSSEQPAPVAELVELAAATSVSGQAASLLSSLPNLIIFSIWTAAYSPLIPRARLICVFTDARHGVARCCMTSPRSNRSVRQSQTVHRRALCMARRTLFRRFAGMYEGSVLDCRHTVANWQAEIIDPIMVTNSPDPFKRQ
jgi:hypothetical protein